MAGKILARFYVAKFEKYPVGTQDGEPVLQANVTLNAVTRKSTEDNIQWAKYSPAGSMTLSVSSAAGGAYDTFESLLGQDVSIEITPIGAYVPE